MAKITIKDGIISSSANYGLYHGTSKIANVEAGGFRVEGDIIAENLVVSSSVTHLTQSFSSGSTVFGDCLLYTSPSPRDAHESRMPSSA